MTNYGAELRDLLADANRTEQLVGRDVVWHRPMYRGPRVDIHCRVVRVRHASAVVTFWSDGRYVERHARLADLTIRERA